MRSHISIIIVNYNVRHFLKRCIESVIRADNPSLNIEIFVVDNASIDGSVDMVRTEFHDVHLIANEDNVGFSVANNQAIKAANSEFVLILNPDTVIQEDTLQVCYDHMQKHQQVGAIGVKMIDGSGNFLPESKRALPTVWNSFSKLVGLAAIFPKSKLFNGYALGHLDTEQQHEVDVLCGAFMFVRANTIKKVGMFDERFFMYGEDIDWSRRIIEGGYKIHYLPETTIIHYKGESTKKASLSYVKTFYSAMGLYVEKHYTGSAGKWFSRFLKIAISARAGVSVLKRVVASVIRPLIDAGIISLAIYGFAQFWETYYFKNAHYYDSARLLWSVISYALIWAFTLWFVGYYKKPSWRRRILGTGVGLLIILSGYALLPESYRSSRVIILFSTVITLVVTWLTSLFSYWNNDKVKTKKILIVADKYNAANIQKSLENADIKSSVIGIVNPQRGAGSNMEYLNDISELAELSSILKADEVIFHSDDMTMKEIMREMMHLDTSLSFKIAGDDSLCIIGSNSKNTSGELYTINIKHNLEDEYYRHIKRSFDFGSAFLLLLLSPILVIVNRFNLVKVYSSIFSVLFGMKTWVGYAGDKAASKNLPPLKDGILSIPDGNDTFTSNMYYSRDYSIWQDAEILMRGLTKL